MATSAADVEVYRLAMGDRDDVGGFTGVLFKSYSVGQLAALLATLLF